MTDRGDDGGFEPHPGDPWHPGWSDDATAPMPIAEPPDGGDRRSRRKERKERDPKPAKPPRESRRERRAREAAEAAGDTAWTDDAPWTDADDEAAWTGAAGDAVPAGDDDAGDAPTAILDLPPTRATPPPVEPIRRPARADAPPPAWMTDPPRPAGGPGEATVPVELPSWVGDTTAGAEGIEAVFGDDGPPSGDTPPTDSERADALAGDTQLAWDEPAAADAAGDVAGSVEEEPFEPATPTVDDERARPKVPADDDPVRAALDALAALGEDEPVEMVGSVPAEPDAGDQSADYGVATAAAFEALRRLEGTDAEAPATPGGAYGVAGKEAFAALGDGDDTEELADWAAFAAADLADAPAADLGRPDADPGPIPEADEDVWTDEPVRERRGIWPFRRRARDEIAEEPIAEETGDWVDAGHPVPDGWFAAVDEDAVVPPPAGLPETEWPVADPDAAFRPPEEQTWTPPPVVRAVPPQEPPTRSVVEPPPAWGAEPPMVAGERVPMSPPPPSPAEPVAAPPPVWEEPAWDEPAATAGATATDDTWGDEWEDETSAEDLDGAWGVGFDDGEPAPLPPVAESPAPRGPRPIDDDPDRTVEMGEFEISETIYAGPGTTEHRGLAEEIFRLGEQDTEWQAMAAAMPGVESGVVGFEDVADLRTGEEYRERARTPSDFGARVATGLVLAVFLIGSLFVGGAALAIFIGALGLLGVYEFYATLRRVGFRPLGVLGLLGSAGILAAAWFHGPIAVPIGLGIVLVLTFFVYAFSPLREDALVNGGFTVLGVGWVAGTLAFATPLLRHADFRMLVLAIVAATVAMDVGAYSVGRTWGRRALAPVLSPNKSVEGLVGGSLLALGAAVAFGAYVAPFDLRAGIGVGAVVVVLAPLGDLAESMVKRSLGVKDMGSILPGHGGILDRIDAFLFVLPAMWVLYRLGGFLG